MAMIQRQIRIPSELWEALKTRAEGEGKDASTVTRELITQYVTGAPPALTVQQVSAQLPAIDRAHGLANHWATGNTRDQQHAVALRQVLNHKDAP